MATTTNYGWTTPDDTALVKDGAAAIRTLGTSVDTTTKNLNPETTLGDIAYRSSTANVKTRLGIGSTGQILTVAGGVPTWASPAGGGGKVLQVIQGTTTTPTSSSSSSYADTTLTATITPTLNTSKILVLVAQNGVGKEGSNGESQVNLKLFRGATEIAFQGLIGYTSVSGVNYVGSASFNYLDSPATTSATTYKTQFANSPAVAVVKVQANNSLSSIILLEIGA